MSGGAATDDDAWRDIAESLEDGETVLWQGRPGRGIRFTSRIRQMLYLAPLSALAGGWMLLSDGIGDAPLWTRAIFWTLLVVGVIGIPQALLGDARRRRHMAYAVTDRRALIASFPFFLGRRVSSIPVANWTDIELVSDGRGLHTVRLERVGLGRYHHHRGIEAIGDGPEVEELVRRLRSEAV